MDWFGGGRATAHHRFGRISTFDPGARSLASSSPDGQCDTLVTGSFGRAFGAGAGAAAASAMARGVPSTKDLYSCEDLRDIFFLKNSFF